MKGCNTLQSIEGLLDNEEYEVLDAKKWDMRYKDIPEGFFEMTAFFAGVHGLAMIKPPSVTGHTQDTITESEELFPELRRVTFSFAVKKSALFTINDLFHRLLHVGRYCSMNQRKEDENTTCPAVAITTKDAPVGSIKGEDNYLSLLGFRAPNIKIVEWTWFYGQKDYETFKKEYNATMDVLWDRAFQRAAKSC